MVEVPEYVSREAERYGLGPLLVWRKSSNPLALFVFFGGIAMIGGLLLSGLLWVLSRFIDQLDSGPAAVVILAGVALVGSAVVGVYGLFKASRRTTPTNAAPSRPQPPGERRDPGIGSTR